MTLKSPRFTPTHEWIHVEDMIATVGITAYAQKELGEIVYVELPQLERLIQAGEEVVILESTKAAADIYAPLSGKIVAVNEALRENVNLLNSAPESDGWLFKLSLTRLEELDALLGPQEYDRLVRK